MKTTTKIILITVMLCVALPLLCMEQESTTLINEKKWYAYAEKKREEIQYLITNAIPCDAQKNGKQTKKQTDAFLLWIKNETTGKYNNKILANTDEVNQFVFSPDGKYLAIALESSLRLLQLGKQINFSDLSTKCLLEDSYLFSNNQKQFLAKQPPIIALCFNNESNTLASFERTTAMPRETKSKKLIPSKDKKEIAMLENPKSNTLASFEKSTGIIKNSIILWNPITGAKLKQMEFLCDYTKNPSKMVFTDHGNKVVIFFKNQKAVTLDVGT